MSFCDGTVNISTALDTDQLEKELKNLRADLETAGESAIGFSDILRGNLLSEVIVGGVQELGSCLKGMATDFIDAAATVKAESSQFEQTFGDLQNNAADAIERVADTSGVLETRLNTLGSSIYAFARSSGGETAESMALMEKALQAAADGAAYYDRSIEDTAETLQSFLKGNYENDAALGLSATETTRNAAAMELFGQKFNDLSEIQKQQTLLQMVLDAQELSGAMGQAAREADGWENVQGNLNEAWRQFMANAGTPLLESIVPIIQSITASLMEWTSAIDWNAFSETVKGFISTVVENGPTIISVIAGIGAGFVAWNVVTMIQGVIGAISAFRAANEELKLSQIALNAVMAANPAAIIATLIAGLVAALVVLWNTNEDFRNAVKEIWESIKDFFIEAWESIKDVWDAVKPYFEAVWKGIKDIFSVVAAVLSGDFGDAWDAVKGIVSGWAKYFSGVWDDIKGVFSNAWQVFKEIGSSIVSGIKRGISNAWTSFKSWVNGLFGGLVNGVKDLLGIHSPSRVFAQIGDYMIQGLSAGMNNGSALAVKSAQGVVKAVANTVGRNIPARQEPGISAWNIPALATGAVIPPNREFLAVLGDQSSGNNIEAPESLIRKIVREEASSEGVINAIYAMASSVVSAIEENSGTYLDGRLISNSTSNIQARQAKMYNK